MRHRIIRPLLAWMTAATHASFNPEENNGTPDPILAQGLRRTGPSPEPKAYIAL